MMSYDMKRYGTIYDMSYESHICIYLICQTQYDGFCGFLYTESIFVSAVVQVQPQPPLQDHRRG